MSSYMYKGSVLLLFIAGVLILQGCGNTEHTIDNKEKQIVEKLPEAFRLEKNFLQSSIRIPGELIAFQQVDLYAKVSSFIKELYVDVGSEVRKGQLLAVMEAPEINEQLAGAVSRLKAQEAVYIASKATYERLLQTSKTPGTVSQNDLDLAYARQQADFAQLEAARAARNEADNTRGYLEIRAPFNGVITARNVSAGAYVGPSGKGSEFPIFTLQEQGRLRLVVSVPESYSGYLKKNSEIEFSVHAMPGERFKSRLTRLAGALDSRLRSQRIEIDVDNKNKILLPGMITEVSIPLNNSAPSYIVPSSAVLSSTQGIFVIKVQDDVLMWQPVKTGREHNDSTEIFGPLETGDILIKDANEEVRNGSPAGKISIVER